MSATKERLSAIKDEMRTLREEAKKRAQEVFSDESKKLFEEFPNLLAFQWTQYTPYFNDGDVCEFSVNNWLNYMFEGDEAFKDVDMSHEAWHYNIEWYEGNYSEIDSSGKFSSYSIKELEKKNDPNLPAIRAVSEFFNIFDEDDFEDIFGDHVEVILTRNGPIVNEYEHD